MLPTCRVPLNRCLVGQEFKCFICQEAKDLVKDVMGVMFVVALKETWMRGGDMDGAPCYLLDARCFCKGCITANAGRPQNTGVSGAAAGAAKHDLVRCHWVAS
jgi:hypothetical protein